MIKTAKINTESMWDFLKVAMQKKGKSLRAVINRKIKVDLGRSVVRGEQLQRV